MQLAQDIQEYKSTHLGVHHVQGSQVVPDHQAGPQDQGVLALPSLRWGPEIHRGHQEVLWVKSYRGK